jgi:hypothetical protein
LKDKQILGTLDVQLFVVINKERLKIPGVQEVGSKVSGGEYGKQRKLYKSFNSPSPLFGFSENHSLFLVENNHPCHCLKLEEISSTSYHKYAA